MSRRTTTIESSVLLQSNQYLGLFLLFGKQVGFMIGVLALLSFGWLIWLKVTIGGGKKIYCEFLDPSGYQSTELLPIQIEEARPTIVSKHDGLPYFVDEDKQRRVMYPPGLPMWLRESTPLQHYVRGNSQPVDVRTVNAASVPGGMAANLKLVKNMSFAGEILEHLENELGIGGLSTKEKILFFGMIGLALAVLGVGFVSWQALSGIQAIHTSMGIVSG